MSTSSRIFQALPTNFTTAPKTTTCLASPPSTPPLETGPSNSESILDLAVHVLATEAASLSHLTRIYTTNPTARTAFVHAVQCITHSLSVNHGKVIFSGMGKSGKIAQKMVATMNSLGLMSFFLHPTEALHGDMGIIRAQDILVLVTYSGTTTELVKILSHVPSQTVVIAMTAHNCRNSCPLTMGRENAIILPTPVHEKEEVTFGVPAPTTSTTVTVALGDALALAVADTMHTIEGRKTQDVFHGFHPGGAIGDRKRTLEDCTAVRVGDIAMLKGKEGRKVADCLVLAFRAKGGWVGIADDGSVVPPRRLRAVDNPDMALENAGILVKKSEMVVLDGGVKIADARGLVRPGQVLEIHLSNGEVGFAESEDIL
ncbi:hypothetical protein TWF225_004659 [Orbilia oligospora]|uniref:Uncharacterized protein n=1 Tax=Orbilia oligospora TaxID=2813651 RepID=A0A7C8PF64_ORBOL|nr:hypothetical protein TWF751_007016 [Orbilia oligospora]KAF3186611.1 hypothetical protein TWF225_004659 [Orbilia oligospora]KAF3246290.1 hypothetical protein TWF217_009962 [Orbilia oligospora]KAF3266093.1 hypothetical protein TWF128_011630 [Orbilia oligospora]KAF3296765.1 hypothetical protein TWF132_009278 [Orbilia oligospora]